MKQEKNINIIMSWLQRNFYLFLVGGIALFVCLFVLYNAREYENQCNQHWEKQFCDMAEQFGQTCYGPSGYITPTPFEDPMQIKIPGYNITLGEIK